VPLFDHFGLDGWTVLRAVMFAGAPSDAAAARIASENFQRGVQPDEIGAARLTRTRWLEENQAERSFPCGVVPEPDPTTTQPEASEPRSADLLPIHSRPMQVIAAVLPKDLVFIREHGTDQDVEEVGRLPRSAIQGVDVVDANGEHVPEPLREEIDEPEQLVFARLRWTNEGKPDDDRFAFRSPWQAWQAAHRLLQAKQG
jgi:hypothetical protein